MAEKEPLLVQEVLGKDPAFLRQQTSVATEVEEPLPGFVEVNLVLPSCVNDTTGLYG